MSAEKFKVVARLGMSTAIPTLIVGEFGFDGDTKTFRVGDDTPQPTKVATNKSTGVIEYSQNLALKFGKIDIHEGFKVDGVDLSTMNQADGIVVRADDGEMVNRLVTGESNYIDVINPTGKDGNIQIKLSENVKTLLGGDTVSSVRFTYGEEFPVEPIPGSLHYLETDETIYIRAKQADETEFWLGLSSFFGDTVRFPKFFQQEDRPINALPGDTWYDPGEDRRYMMFFGEEHPYWVQIQ